MSIRNAKSFLVAVQADRSMQLVLAGARSPEEVVKLGASLGFRFSASEICAVREALNAEDRARVAGRKVFRKVVDGMVTCRVSYIARADRPPSDSWRISLSPN